MEPCAILKPDREASLEAVIRDGLERGVVDRDWQLGGKFGAELSV
jgi:hypothetical protein